MRKQTTGGSTEPSTSTDGAAADTPQAATPVTAPAADAPPPAAADEPAPINPHEGGCYVRQPDGSLSREED